MCIICEAEKKKNIANVLKFYQLFSNLTTRTNVTPAVQRMTSRTERHTIRSPWLYVTPAVKTSACKLC